MSQKDNVIDFIGRDHFKWLSSEFCQETTLKDIPDEILSRIMSVDITRRDYAEDRNAVTSIALITFAYKMAGKIQLAPLGPKDMLLLKTLAKEEKSRRKGKSLSRESMWEMPLFELITGEIGERIRKVPTMNSPV
jgi:hypothetical protein